MKGLTAGEMAERLGISPNAVKSRLHRAKIQARDYVGMVSLYSEKDFRAIEKPKTAGRPRKVKG